MTDSNDTKTSGKSSPLAMETVFTLAFSGIALFAALVGNLGILVSSGIGIPIIFLVSCAIIVLVLIRQKLLFTQNGVIIFVAVLAAITIGYISQPATISGQILRPNGTPAPNVTLILINSNGISQTAITDSEGRFTIRNVPEGTYRITDDNGALIQSGDIFPGWQRLSPQVMIGSITRNMNVAPVAKAQPTQTSLVAPTPKPSSTPAPVSTPTAIPTEIPESAVLLSEDFEDGVPNNFQVNDGRWTIVGENGNKAYQVSTGNTWGEVSLGASSWENYAIEGRFKLIARARGAILRVNFRQTEPINIAGYDIGRYVFSIQTDGVHIEQILVRKDTVWESKSMAFNTAYGISTSDWNTFRVDVKTLENAILIKGWINDQQLSDVYDENLTFKKGKVTLIVEPEITLLLDDLHIWKIDN